jgi:multisubunit Na+/H+ antiporter MnhB subunit
MVAAIPADSLGETLSAAGLILNVTSIVTFTVCLAMFGTGAPAVGLVLGALAVVTFVLSIGCFIADRRHSPRSRTTTPDLPAPQLLTE